MHFLPERPKNHSTSTPAFTLVEWAIALAVFAIIAVSVVAATMRIQKDAAEARRNLAAYSVATNILQQIYPLPPAIHEAAFTDPEGYPYVVYDLAGKQQFLMPAAQKEVLFTAQTEADPRKRVPAETFPVRVWVELTPVPNYTLYQLKVTCAYESPVNEQWKSLTVSSLTSGGVP